MNETRIKKIVDILTKDFQFHTSKEIAKQLNISSRTVRETIKEFNSIESTGSKINTVPGKGVIFEILDQNMFRTFLSNEWFKYAYENRNLNNPSYRVEYLIKSLLDKNQYVKAQEFADEMKISRSQLNLDLREADVILSSYNLNIESKPYNGIKITGSESNKRSLLFKFFSMENVGMALEKNGFDFSLFKKINDIFTTISENNNFKLNELSQKNFIIHLYVMIKRISKNYFIKVVNNNSQITDEVKDIINKVTDALSSELNMEIPSEEKEYMAIHLIGKRNVIDKTISPKIEELTYRMINNIKTDYGVDLLSDLELRINLGLHLGPLIERINSGYSMKNPLLEDIKKDSISYEFSKSAVRVLEKEYGVKLNQDEIGYIALHISLAVTKLKEYKPKYNILIVCATGQGTAKLVEYRFKKVFEDNIKHLKTIDYSQIKKVDIKKYNLIVSTFPIENINIEIPIIEVGVLLDENDIFKINNYLLTKEKALNFEKLFNEDLFYINNHMNLRDKNNVLSFLCEEITEKTGIDNELFDLIIEREKLHTSSLGNGIALPHPIEPITKETFITIYIDKYGIKWDGDTVYLVILLNIKKGEERKDVEGFLLQLSKFIYNNDILKELKNVETLVDFINVFNNK